MGKERGKGYREREREGVERGVLTIHREAMEWYHPIRREKMGKERGKGYREREREKG